MDKSTDWRSGTRRIFSNEFKLHMVELASKPNANVAQLAREHCVGNNLIFKWLRLWQREGRISRRMPPTIVGPTVPQSFPASPTLFPVELILYRQSEIFALQGVELSRALLSNWGDECFSLFHCNSFYLLQDYLMECKISVLITMFQN